MSYTSVYDVDEMKPIFDLIEDTRNIKQSPIHHPEGTVFNHSLQTFKCAIRETNCAESLLAALCHDVGKVIISHGHEKEGSILLKENLSVKSLWLIENHMKIWYFLIGEMRKYSKCYDLMNHPWLKDLIMLARWDRMGRNPNIQYTEIDKEWIVNTLNDKAKLHFTENLL